MSKSDIIQRLLEEGHIQDDEAFILLQEEYDVYPIEYTYGQSTSFDFYKTNWA
jgi:hypothetical protein